eukprot:6346921-Prymnesium_polylepis.1
MEEITVKCLGREADPGKGRPAIEGTLDKAFKCAEAEVTNWRNREDKATLFNDKQNRMAGDTRSGGRSAAGQLGVAV